MSTRQASRPNAPKSAAIAAVYGVPSDECMACGRLGKVERAHIVPHAVQPEDNNSPDDFLLLCPACHVQAPDVADPEYVWEWINQERERHMDAMFGAFFEEMAVLPEVAAWLTPERVQSAMTEVGQRVSYHQGRLSVATKAWVVRETIKMLREEMVAQRQGATS